MKDYKNIVLKGNNNNAVDWKKQLTALLAQENCDYIYTFSKDNKKTDIMLDCEKRYLVKWYVIDFLRHLNNIANNLTGEINVYDGILFPEYVYYINSNNEKYLAKCDDYFNRGIGRYIFDYESEVE